MSKVWIRHVYEGNDEHWEVWTALNENHDHLSSEAFIIGLGPTKREAISDALNDLETRAFELRSQQ